MTATSTMNVLTRKLEWFGPLSDDDRRFLDDLVARPRSFGAREDLIRERDRPVAVKIVMEGVVCRYKMVKNGERQIFAYLVAGDICDLHVVLLREMDHSIATLSPCKVVDVPQRRVQELMQRPALAQALQWDTLVSGAVSREWIVNLGRRNAEERIAHLFCEIHLRLHAVGLAPGDRFEWPVTQLELGDSVGLSQVHVNRSLQHLRTQNLLQFRSGLATIPDVERLRAMSGFNPNYLHYVEPRAA